MVNKTYIDLFCGCGGFSLGANLAGYKNLLSVDIDPILTSAYKLNFPNSNLQLANLATIPDIRKLLKNPDQKPSLLIGGPPCQGFSFMGKRDEHDPRNELIWHYFRHVKRLRPDIFILENVAGLASGYGLEAIEIAKSQLPKYYKVSDPIFVNAADFGAATTRPRVLIIGYDSENIAKPDFDAIANFKVPFTSVKDAISDLPSPVKYDDKTYDWVKYKRDIDISDYAIKLRKVPKKKLGWEHAIQKLENGFVSGLSSTLHNDEVKQRFKDTQQGDNEPISRYFRLKWDAPSRTIRAGTGSDKGGFQSARPIHPSQPRVITVREGARIQGFPDWFVFHHAKWHSFRMIGNSVSPIMAEKLASLLSGK